MDKRNLQRIFMMQSLLGFAKSAANQPIVVQIPAFNNGLATLQNIVDKIDVISGQQSMPVAGGGAQKLFYRRQLNQITFAIINIVKGYALSVNNFELAQQLSFSLTPISRLSDKLIAPKAGAWKDMIETLLPNLASWGVTNTSIQNWETAIANYQSAYQLPINKKNARKQLTAQVNTLIRQGVGICKNTLDTSVNSFTALGYTAFVQQYYIYRKLQHTATSHIRLPGASKDKTVNKNETFIFDTNKSMQPGKNSYALVHALAASG